MSEKPKEKKLKGVVAVLVTDDGTIAATGTDFDYTHAAGYRLEDAQERRARQDLIRNFLDAWIGRRIAPYIDSYTAESIMDDMITKAKWKIHYKHVNHDEEET